MRTSSPEKDLAGFLSKYTPEIAAVARAARVKLCKRLPGAVEMVYDNYNALVIGFGPTERTSDAVFSIALYPRWVTLFFLNGAKLKDPDKQLRGSGKQVRHIRLDGATDLDAPAVRSLMTEAIQRAGTPFDAGAHHRLIIKSVSEKQRPRQ